MVKFHLELGKCEKYDFTTEHDEKITFWILKKSGKNPFDPSEWWMANL